MKLLLTSGGITNPTIARALQDLVGKPFTESSVAFVPTAANVFRGDKSWMIEDLTILRGLGFRSIDIVDISAVSRELWLPGFEMADILFFEGGDTFHLMDWIEKSGLWELLPDMLKTKVYVGVSAGSIVAGRSLDLHFSERLYAEPTGLHTRDAGLRFVDFLVRAHVGSPAFPGMNFQVLDEIAKEHPETFYAIDDETAIKVIDQEVEIVSEGSWKKYH